jgi:hypothetical protein
MSFQNIYDLKLIAGKRIYIVDDHHKALAAWAIERRQLELAPNLITIDHHTDVNEAFLGHAHIEVSEKTHLNVQELMQSLAAQIDWRDDEKILSAIEYLRHNEQIDAATTSDVLSSAFCIQLTDNCGTPSTQQLAYDAQIAVNFKLGSSECAPPVGPKSYTPTANKIYVIGYDCAIGCNKQPYDDDCAIHHASEIIESKYLEDQLVRGSEIAICLGLQDLESAPYILDIDLDVFHTAKSINPDDTLTFYRLIRNAIAITIATESECVEDEWLDDQNCLHADELLRKLLQHIESALC